MYIKNYDVFVKELTEKFKANENVCPFLKRNGYYKAQIDEIIQGLHEGININWYINRLFNSLQMEQIRLGLTNGIDVSLYADRRFYWKAMKQIRFALEERLNFEEYINLDFNYKQLQQIRYGLEQEIDVYKYAKSSVPWLEMKEIREQLIHNKYRVDNKSNKRMNENNSIILKKRMKGVKYD